MDIALVTATGVDIGAIDDSVLLQAFHARGLRPEVVRWDDPSVDWPAFDAVWLRSCWDYHKRYPDFVSWLHRAARDAVRFVNPAALVLKNAHKGYLLGLQAAGIPVPPLHLAPGGEPFDTARFLAGSGWPDTVIKPAVSASAYNTWRAGAVPVAESAARVDEMLASGDVILQRFVPEIGTRGEWSLIYIDGALSHAVRRLPPAGEFRSQLEFGATLSVEPPSAAMAGVARAALASISDGEIPCMARLDLVESDEGPVVMEVELIEPVLYFRQAAGAADRAIDALLRRVRAHTSV